MQVLRTWLAVALFAASTLALAHHGWSGYDASQTLTLTGKVAAVDFTYPHATIRLEAQGKTWVAVLAPPYRMENRGLPGDNLKAGMTVTVVGYPHREDAAEMRAERIVVGEKTVELR